jgi:prepilin-type N-terminal cleavage/methylation domain-containing protein
MLAPQKGFTLIELLVVIAIIAILSVVVILTLNPAQLLRESRDSNRLSDMGTIKNAVSIYFTDQQVAPANVTSSECYATTETSSAIFAPASPTDDTIAPTSDCTPWFVTASGPIIATGSVAVDGTGWLPLDFDLINSGSPISQEPIDPINSAGNGSTEGYFYSFIMNGTQFKMATKMESTEYSSGGDKDAESTDGGENPWIFELGNNLAM